MQKGRVNKYLDNLNMGEEIKYIICWECNVIYHKKSIALPKIVWLILDVDQSNLLLDKLRII